MPGSAGIERLEQVVRNTCPTPENDNKT